MARTPDGRECSSTSVCVTGLPSRYPSPPPITSSSGFRSRLGLSDVVADAWRVDHDSRGSFDGFDVAAQPAAMDAFGTMHAFLSTESGFARTVNVQRRIGNLVEALRGCVYRETTPEATSVTEITEAAPWWDVVIAHFGLD